MKLKIRYIPPNWNEYINLERANKYQASKLKAKEKEYVKWLIKEKYDGGYPIKIIFNPHFKDHRQDLDNFRYKGLLDGLVANNVIKNDNLVCIQEIVLKPVFDDKELTEIEIEELGI